MRATRSPVHFRLVLPWAQACASSACRYARTVLQLTRSIFDQGACPAMASTIRRPAAILAADVAGYSRLMGADEKGTHERLQAHLRELVNP